MILHQHFVQIAKKYGKKLAFIDRTVNRRITYSKALVASLILAKRFKEYDEGFLGIMLPTSAGCALSILGTLMSGRTPVMLNYSTGAAKNAAYAKHKCNFNTIITSRLLLEKINCPHIEGMVYIEDIMNDISSTEKLKAAVRSKLPVPLILKGIYEGKEDDDIAILFTSGSENDPKAVQLTHQNIVSNLEGITAVVNLSEKDRLLANLPFFHVFGLTVDLWLPLYHGMTTISHANPLDYKYICEIIREEEPSIMAATPSFFWGYLRKSEPGDFQSVRLAISGADKCPDSLRKAFLKKHNLTILEGYGCTETSPVISVNTPDSNRPGSIGKVLPNVEVRIENYETGEECAIKEVGKIMVKGDLVMKGYLGDFEETSMRIRHGWYDTGDMGYLDEDGYLWHAGRLRRFVKIGGEMISLVRVEDILVRILPEDISCCVVDIPDRTKGAKIVAAVTQRVDEKSILKKIAEELPNIALPNKFVIIDDLPKMGSGKIDFRAVADIVQDMLSKEN